MRQASAIPLAPAVMIVVAATCYAALLCFINTHVMGISNTLVMLTDGAILLTALVFALQIASRPLWILLLFLAGNFLVLALLSDRLEMKPFRDVLAPIAFSVLGLRHGTLERTTRAFWLISAVVIAIALFEFIWPSAYLAVFNVIDFYAARGMVDDATMQRLNTDFFVSGARDGERVLLPFLGPHRVSSIFLEPVSMGNFGALAVAFALSLGRTYWRSALIAGTVGFTAIVLADARFASVAAPLFVMARFAPARWRPIGLALLPLLCIGLIVGFGLSNIGHGDDLPTRLARSGRILLELPPPAVFGVSYYSPPTYDSGYAYALSAFGLPMCAVLWAAFVLMPAPTKESSRYKFLLGIYICSLLCISGSSAFALKTAALAFFALGALAASGASRRVIVRRARAPMMAQGRPA